MKEFIEKLIGRLEEIEEHCLDMHNWQGQSAIVEAKEIVNQLAEEYNQEHDDTDYANIELYAFWQKHQWILCSERLPEEKENPITSNYYVYPVMVQFEHITDIRYYSFGNGHWWHGPSIMDKYVTHWMDIAPYQPKGE